MQAVLRFGLGLGIGLLMASAGCRRGEPPRAHGTADASAPHPGCADPKGVARPVPAAFAKTGAHGIDVSHYNGEVPWRTFAEGGLDYVFVKATDGVSYEDPRFAEHWAAARRCGLARGAYHFLRMKDDPRAQAEHFVSVLKADPGELPAVVDVERAGETGGVPCAVRVAKVRAFLEAAEAALGKKLMIYSGREFWRSQLCDAQDFSDRPLWVARYSAHPPEPFGGWKTWNFWQYTENFRAARDDFDLDRASADGEALVSRGGTR